LPKREEAEPARRPALRKESKRRSLLLNQELQTSN
jgi:hypothetical protein